MGLSKTAFLLCLIVFAIKLARFHAQQNFNGDCPSVCRCYAQTAVCSRRWLTSIPEFQTIGVEIL